MKRNRSQLILTAALAGLLALAIGCTSIEAPPPIATPAPIPTAPATVEQPPALTVDKLRVDLGTLTRNQEATQTFIVMNKGSGPLQLESVTIQDEEGRDEAETVQRGSEVLPGEAAILPVKIGPHSEVGPRNLLITLSSNDPVRPVFTIPVTFTVTESESPPGTGPRLIVDKEIIDNRTVPFDWPLFEQFTLYNAGDEPLVLDGMPIVRVEEGC